MNHTHLNTFSGEVRTSFHSCKSLYIFRFILRGNKRVYHNNKINIAFSRIKDLAAHFSVIKAVGQTLYGKPISDVFGEVKREYFLDSIMYDVYDSVQGISGEPIYFILNLCRAAAFFRENKVLSKSDGAEWAAENLNKKYTPLVNADRLSVQRLSYRFNYREMRRQILISSMHIAAESIWVLKKPFSVRHGIMR